MKNVVQQFFAWNISMLLSSGFHVITNFNELIHVTHCVKLKVTSKLNLVIMVLYASDV